MTIPFRPKTPTHGIPTMYRGTRFRSRLEARWAALFDLIEWPWVYEPFDTAEWIPDFLVTGPAPFLVEVGPCETEADYTAKASKPLAAFPEVHAYCERMDHESCSHADDYIVSRGPDRVTLVVGTLPIFDTNLGIAAGLITSDGDSLSLAPAVWGRCETCWQVCVTHAYLIYRHFPCGHWHDNTCQSMVLEGQLVDLWNRASTPVQWRGRRAAS